MAKYPNPAEDVVLKTIQCGFDPHLGYRGVVQLVERLKKLSRLDNSAIKNRTFNAVVAGSSPVSPVT
jgi:hypothetical protein